MTQPLYPLTDRQARSVALAQELAAKFRRRAAEHDRAGSFPHENYADFRKAGMPALVVPTAYGGQGATLLETVLVVETLGVGDGSTALAATMHFQTLGSAAEMRTWPENLFAQLCRAAVEQGALVNSIATEPELGSPSRGGKPKTTARPVAAGGRRPAGWVVNGRKNFASLSPTLDYMLIPAALQDGSDLVAIFVITPGEGVVIEETWDALGMRATGSHDVIFNEVFVPTERMIPAPPASPDKPKSNAWFALTVSAAYLGVAVAALQCAADFAQGRAPTALGKPIAELESIQRRLGQAELLIHQARMALYHAADLWDRYPDRREDLGESVLVAKYTVTNHAIDAVDHCMRVVGGASMGKDLPLERYYRDVRGGLNHPVNDDQALVHLGRLALERYPRV